MLGDVRAGVVGRDLAGHGHQKTDLVLTPMPIPFGRVVGCSFDWIRISLATFEDLQATTVHHHARHVGCGRGVCNRRLAAIHQRQHEKVLNGLVALFDTFTPDFFGDAFDLLGSDSQSAQRLERGAPLGERGELRSA